MRSILHILTRPDDLLARQIISCQEDKGENKISVADLTQPSLDYRGLLEKIFAADSVQTW